MPTRTAPPSAAHLTDELTEVRCGWPVRSSAWMTLRCVLYVFHAGPVCQHQTTLESAPVTRPALTED